MQEIETEAAIFFTLLLSALALAILNGVLWIVLHNILYKKLDNILFREPWFSRAELAMYSGWPLSLIKSMIYMFLILAPDYSKKRRFKGLDQEIRVNKAVSIASKLCVFLLLLTALLGVAFFVYGGFLYIINRV